VLDNYAYLVHKVGRRQEFDALTGRWMDSYTALFKVPVIEAPSFDGMRDVSGAFQMEIDAVIDRVAGDGPAPQTTTDRPVHRRCFVSTARVAKAGLLSIVLAAMLPLVAAAQSAAPSDVPTPEEIIGFAPGTDLMLADYGQITAYFQALAEASDRVILEQVGESSRGKPMYLALISTSENLANRQRYQEISRRLALAKDLTEEEARQLADEGKAIVWIDIGLHATEVAHGQHGPALAHWLATSEDAEARRVRENVILLLMVNMNPDGLDIVVDWYRQVVGTPFETAPVPELYHHYIGHDNNRDWYMFTQVEHQAVARQLYHEWFRSPVASGCLPWRIRSTPTWIPWSWPV
jgi:hypothetical protein